MNGAKRVVAIVFVALFVVGCSGGGIEPSPKPPVSPGDGGTVVADGPDALFRGTVVFHDTNIGLWSTFTSMGKSAVAEHGNFGLVLPQGRREYEIGSLLGSHRDALVHDGDRPKTIRFPAFPGWSRSYFDALLVGFGKGEVGTIRWPRHSEIPIWIETPQHNKNVTDKAVDKTVEAFDMWQDVLSGAITFKRTTSKSLAETSGIMVTFAPQKEVAKGKASTVIGYCSISYYPSTGIVPYAKVVVAYEYQESISLLLHEIGHCIGISHSPDEDDVMYAFLLDADQGLTEKEKQIARLLYSIPRTTPALSKGAQSLSTSFVPTEENDEGIVTETIPSFAPGN